MDRRLLKPLDEFTAADLEALVSERLPEGQRLEYKRELNLVRDKDKQEAAKDVSGFANATGGLVVFGIDEEELPDGQVVPTAITPLVDGSLRTRLEDVLDSTVSPTLNLDTSLVDVDGGYCLLVRAFQRAGALHMVEGFGDGRHYLRVGHKTRRMSQHEIEREYASLGRREERLKELLTGAPIIARVGRTRSQDEFVRSAHGKQVERRPWMYVVTAPLDGGPTLLPMRNPAPSDFPERPDGRLRSRDLGAGYYKIDAGGYLQEAAATSTGLAAERIRLLRSGLFEWGFRFDREDYTVIPATAFFERAHDALLYFARVYGEVGYHGRLRFWIGIDNADEGVFWIPRELSDPEHWSATQDAEDLWFPQDGHVDALVRDPMPRVARAMDYIWQAFGHRRCLLVDDDGEWLGSP